MNFDLINIEKPDIIDLLFVNKIKNIIGDYFKDNLRSFLFIFRNEHYGFWTSDVKYKIIQFNNVLTYMFSFNNDDNEYGDVCTFTVEINEDSIYINNIKLEPIITRTIEDEWCGQQRTIVEVSFHMLEVFHRLFCDKLKFHDLKIEVPNNVLFRIDDIKLHTYDRYTRTIVGTPKIVFDKFICSDNLSGIKKYDAFKAECKKHNIKLYYDCHTYNWWEADYYDRDKKILSVLIKDTVVDTFQYVSCNSMHTQHVVLIA